MELLWQVLNDWLIAIIDVMMLLWPSTPLGLKLSTLTGELHTAWPLAPWWLLGTFIESATWVFGAIGGIKLFKLVWP